MRRIRIFTSKYYLIISKSLLIQNRLVLENRRNFQKKTNLRII